MVHQQLEPHQDLPDQVQQPMVHQQLDPLKPHQEALEQHQRHHQRKLAISVMKWNILPLLFPQIPLSYNP
jgi:type VI protein secretion system component VasK